MTTNAKVIVTVLFLAVIAGVVGIDAWRNNREWTAMLSRNEAQTEGTGDTPVTGVAKHSGPDVAATIEHLGFQTEATTEMSLIEQVIQDKTAVLGRSILKDGDRAGSVTWVESLEVKTIFNALKESLLPAFSPHVTDLQDRTEAKPGQPVRNILTFYDPGLSEERLAFVRVRERLYEFHIAKGKEEVMMKMIEEVTKL